MALIIEPEDLAAHRSDIIEMYRQRCRVFWNRMNWNVQVSGDMEVDEFDAASPTYVLVLNEYGDTAGSARLLSTTGPYMLRNIFPALLGGISAPAKPSVWETSRFAVDSARITRDTEAIYGDTTSRLVVAIIEYALANGIEQMLAVTDVRVERVLRKAGLVMQRFTSARQVGETRAVAVSIPMDVHQVARVCRYGGIDSTLKRLGKERVLA